MGDFMSNSNLHPKFYFSTSFQSLTHTQDSFHLNQIYETFGLFLNSLLAKNV